MKAAAAIRARPAPQRKARARGAAAVQGVLPERAPFTDIWRAVAAVPAGSWTSYGEVARRVGLARGARLVGFALKRAPDGLELPWHRVVGAGGRIALPAGSRAALEQARRLAREGVRVERGRIRGAAPGPAARSLDELLWRRDGD